ncbi:HIRAN domain-containing protein [Sphingomonas nostoxanthinifaciens]|uniref:HIRAN domain-containing protein n=1 Tax=Sphingomonas nostoxanthinifaciens TaxID=2872652 RepID=UPI001CC20DCE|nr:HIRAN domain-containing protein [Sphingomonas nostoxanthinifaciens]UAK23642.1 HIRAN domain-containing protein [Sphingomonas nostoxanthinifaciens]
MPIAALSLAVVGAAHSNKKGAPTRAFAIQLCRPGDTVELVPEPKNPADPHAVMVLNREGMQMGYLTAERAPWIGGMLGQGREIRAVFQEPTSYGAVIRVAFDGEEPALPAPRERETANREVDFYPDEIYPDE